MTSQIAIAVLMVCLADGHPNLTERLNDWSGQWVIVRADSSIGQHWPDELSSLAKRGAEVAVKGNELTVGSKLVATLTTDFSRTGIDLDKAVWVTRRPAMLTTPSGQGVLCAYEVNQGTLELCYPHTQGRIGAGTRIYFKRTDK